MSTPRRSLTIAAALLLGACGFQLRGTGSFAVSPALSPLNVVAGNVDNALVTELRQVLAAQPGLQLSEQGAAATLNLKQERIDSRVASVRTATAKAAEYQLRYALEFEVLGRDGAVWAPVQTVRFNRDYTFDPNRVIAKEHEQQELLRELRRDAVQHIVRRLSRLKPAAENATTR